MLRLKKKKNENEFLPPLDIVAETPIYTFKTKKKFNKSKYILGKSKNNRWGKI